MNTPTPGTVKTSTLPVRWCKEFLRTHGWTVGEVMHNTGGQRLYPVTNTEGLHYDLTTYGLRRLAYKVYTMKNLKERYYFPVDNTLNT